MNNKLFDIVIPLGPNDIEIINKQILYTKKNIIGYRNIYIICNIEIYIEDCIIINENIFPFTIETVKHFHGDLWRNCWYLQQLLKFYAGIVIDGILDTYLVIDADTFFIKPTTFIENNKCLYNYATEYHIPYFVHMLKLNKNLIKVNQMSGISHHMIFETKYIKEIINMIENEHCDTFYNIFLKLVVDIEGSGASEYEIYFNYMQIFHNDKIKIRYLNFINSNTLYHLDNDSFDYISYHHYIR
jgi:hypothetical protein